MRGVEYPARRAPIYGCHQGDVCVSCVADRLLLADRCDRRCGAAVEGARGGLGSWGAQLVIEGTPQRYSVANGTKTGQRGR